MADKPPMAPVARDVLELLEVAHGYALLGSIMPMRAAALDCGVSKGSVVWNLAHNALHEQLGERETKPSMEDYTLALANAIDAHIRKESLPHG